MAESKPPTCHICGARLVYVHPEWHMEPAMGGMAATDPVSGEWQCPEVTIGTSPTEAMTDRSAVHRMRWLEFMAAVLTCARAY
jgi:hypothetical protein